MIDEREIRHGHLCCGLGSGAAGFNDARAEVGNMRGKFRCIGGIDVDKAGIADFEKLTGVRGTVQDLFDIEQYLAFHGYMPPPGWREAVLLRAYGYAVSESDHDCGELAGLPQSRKRFLLVARHMEKVPPFLYQVDKKPLRAVGDWLGKMPMPGDERAGVMHRIPSLQWKTWVRLAFVEAGSDWRSLNKLAVENGVLANYLIVPCSQQGTGPYGVKRWEDSADAIAGRSGPSNGPYSCADPRPFADALQYGQYGVNAWDDSMGAVIGVKSPGQGGFSVADPRVDWNDGAHQAKLRVTEWQGTQGPVTGARGPYSGACSVADPRPYSAFQKWCVTRWDGAANAVIAGSTTGQGAVAVADPRAIGRGKGDHYLTGGHYGVVRWECPSGAVSASACHDNGNWSVADPRDPTCTKSQTDLNAWQMPAPTDKLIAIIRALDGTWHRPFTTLELAVLQSIVDPEDSWVPWKLQGESDQAWRERIGNAVPRKSARAIAEVIGETLLLAWSGETFRLSAKPIWVRPVAVALSVEA